MERDDKTFKEKEMMVIGYGSDGKRAMIVTDNPDTLAWFAARFERIEYKKLKEK